MILLANFLTDFFVGVDHARLVDFLIRLAFNLVSIFILIRFIYYQIMVKLKTFTLSL